MVTVKMEQIVSGSQARLLKTELLQSGGGFDDDISNYRKESVKRSLIIEILRNDPEVLTIQIVSMRRKILVKVQRFHIIDIYSVEDSCH